MKELPNRDILQANIRIYSNYKTKFQKIIKISLHGGLINPSVNKILWNDQK